MRTFEHISAEAIERYGQRRLSSEELLSTHAHAAECAECRARLESTFDVQGSFANLFADFNAPEDEPEHLPYAQLAAFVDDSMDEVEREIAESHLAVCRACAGDAGDLRRYQTIAATSETTAANPVAPARAAASKSLRQRLASFSFADSFGWSLPSAAAAAVAVAVVLFGVWFATRTDERTSKDQLAQVKPDGREQSQNAPTQTTGTASDNGAVDNKDAAGNSRPTTAQEDVSSSTKNSSRSIVPSSASRRSPSSTSRSSVREPAPATPHIALLDGSGEVALDRRGGLRGLEDLPPEVRKLVGQTLRSGSVQMPRSLDSLKQGAGGVLMGGDSGVGGVPFALVSPVGKILLEQRPVLRWRALVGASSYTVAIVNADFKQVAQSEKLRATEWTPPIALERGATYFWQVTAIEPDGREINSPGPNAPQAKFQVLDARTFDELKSFAAVHPDSHLALGVLYAKAGLLDEAGNEFEKLVKQNPRSPVARRLLQSVR